MRIKRWMSLLKSYLEAAWMSVRFCLMLRKMDGQRTERAKNRQGMLWGILCSIMCAQGIFTCMKGYVEMLEGNAGGIKKMLEGAGAATAAATMKQCGGVLAGTEMLSRRTRRRSRRNTSCFSRARTANVISQAFKEFVYGNEKKKGRVSIRQKLKNFKDAVMQDKNRERSRDKDRGQSL